MRLSLPLVVAVALVVACGAGAHAPAEAPTKLDDGAASSTSVEKLCGRYVALEDAAMKLDDKGWSYKLEKCTSRARALKADAPKEYTCLVQCTFLAETYARARDCRLQCQGSSETPAD